MKRILNSASLADNTKYKGSWESLVAGHDNLLMVISEPIEKPTNLLEVVCIGNLNVLIVGDYNGDFLKIKYSTNIAISSILSYIVQTFNLVIAEINALIYK